MSDQGELTIDDALRLAIDLHQSGRVSQAAEVYQRILEVQPNHVDALHFMGMAEHQCGRTPRGLELLRRCIELSPGYADAHNNLGNVLLQLGRLADADASYERSLALRPNDPNALNNLATARKRQGKLEQAQRLLGRALELAPNHPDALQNLGNVLSALGDFDAALDTYQRAILLRPYDGASHRLLGAALQAVGRAAEAAEIYRKWCELEPDDPEARHMLAACTGANVPERTSDQAVQQLFDRFAASFDHVLLERLGYRAPELIAQAVELALGPAPSDPALCALDMGCGTGLCAPWLRSYAQRMVGVDLSPAMLARADERKAYDALLAEELTEHLRAHASHYDLIVAADVLVYFGDLGAVARAATQALRRGGHLAFTVERALPEDAPAGFRINPHGRYSHTDAYLRTTLAAAGLRVVSLSHAHLRTEFAKPVDGWVVVAERSS